MKKIVSILVFIFAFGVQLMNAQQVANVDHPWDGGYYLDGNIGYIYPEKIEKGFGGIFFTATKDTAITTNAVWEGKNLSSYGIVSVDVFDRTDPFHDIAVPCQFDQDVSYKVKFNMKKQHDYVVYYNFTLNHNTYYNGDAWLMVSIKGLAFESRKTVVNGFPGGAVIHYRSKLDYKDVMWNYGYAGRELDTIYLNDDWKTVGGIKWTAVNNNVVVLDPVFIGDIKTDGYATQTYLKSGNNPYQELGYVQNGMKQVGVNQQAGMTYEVQIKYRMTACSEKGEFSAGFKFQNNDTISRYITNNGNYASFIEAEYVSPEIVTSCEVYKNLQKGTTEVNIALQTVNGEGWVTYPYYNTRYSVIRDVTGESRRAEFTLLSVPQHTFSFSSQEGDSLYEIRVEQEFYLGCSATRVATCECTLENSDFYLPHGNQYSQADGTGNLFDIHVPKNDKQPFSNWEVMLFNSAGQKVFQKTLSRGGGAELLDLSNLAIGAYYLQVLSQSYPYNGVKYSDVITVY